MCKEQGFEMSQWYLLKTYLQEDPVVTIVVLEIFVILVFAYVIRIFEMPYYTAIFFGEDMETHLSSFGNALWFTTQTITTVGEYGDYCPMTPLGRFFAGLLCFIGALSMSILVSTWTLQT